MEEDFYLLNFLNDRCLRDSCYECQFRGQHVSDITVADFWEFLRTKNVLISIKSKRRRTFSDADEY